MYIFRLPWDKEATPATVSAELQPLQAVWRCVSLRLVARLARGRARLTADAVSRPPRNAIDVGEDATTTRSKQTKEADARDRVGTDDGNNLSVVWDLGKASCRGG